MQQYTPYFPTTNYGNQQDTQQQQQQQQQQQAAPAQGQDAQQQQVQQPQQQTPQPQQAQPQAQPQPQLPMSGPNLAIYSSAAMPPLSVLATPQVKADGQQPQQPGMGVVPTVDLGAHGKPKRKQVKNACVNCQKACKKCDEGRPCQRCIKYGLTDTCVNSVRKERKKGIKRGPYKKRNKNANPESATTSGTTTPNTLASPMVNAAIYGQNSNVDASTMPIHYQPFTTQAAANNPYAYAYNNQMMSSAYMLPAAIQQMYPTNPQVLSYQAAVNMLSPQQQQTQQSAAQQQQQQDQSSVVNNGYRPQDQQQMGSTATDAMNQNNGSAVGTPASNAAAGDITKVEDEDEGSKLNLLSQLCSAVLKDRNDLPKQEVMNGAAVGTNNAMDGSAAAEPASSLPVAIKAEESHQNTPPPSGPHTREPSQDNNTSNNSNKATSAVNNLVLPGGGSSIEGSSQSYANGTLGQTHTGAVTNSATTTSTVSTPTSAAYGTPGSSPADSPALNKQNWNVTSDQQQQQQNQPTAQENTSQQQPQTQ